MGFPAESIASADGLVVRWKTDGIGVGDPIKIFPYADKSYGMYSKGGNWNSASINLEGSWDVDNSPPADNTWVILYESDNTTAITITANGAGVILENPLWIRPNRTAGAAVEISVVLTGVTK